MAGSRGGAGGATHWAGVAGEVGDFRVAASIAVVSADIATGVIIGVRRGAPEISENKALDFSPGGSYPPHGSLIVDSNAGHGEAPI